MSGNKEVNSILGKRLKMLRSQRELTLTGLAERSGISKGSLSVLEDGRGNPTISTIWRLADALEIPFGELAKFNHSKNPVEVEDQGVSIRLIEQSSGSPLIETYLMKLAPGSKREAEPHSPGVIEKVMILKGRLLTGSFNSPVKVSTGENYEFNGDCVHLYQALKESVTAMISVLYPDENQVVDSYTRYRQVTADDDKEGLVQFINRHIIEVINGVKSYRLIFKVSSRVEDVLEHIENGLSKIKNHEFSFPIHIFIREKNRKIEVYLLPGFNSGIAFDSKYLHDLYLEELKKASSGRPGKNKPEKTYQELLYEWVESQSMTLSTLAAEALTLQGIPTLPASVRDKSSFDFSFEKKGDPEDRSFEDRINTGHYDSFELLHPGYARQAPAMAQMIYSHYKKTPEKILDIGTGPGHPLFMLLEFFPDAKAIAVDPSPASCACLKQNIKGKKIILLREDFLNLKYQGATPVITSVGASHHFNTAFFFQKARNLLRDNGLLVVADEFLTPFSCQEERNSLLVRHHLMYMLDVLANVSNIEIEKKSDDEAVLIEAMKKELPVMYFEATTGMTETAVRRARKLLQLVHSLTLPDVPGSQYVMFFNFMVLELEALVAGLDYEVEQKTYPDNFIFLAEYAGFKLEEHRRVYPTVGHNPMEGGTHVFAFSKQV